MDFSAFKAKYQKAPVVEYPNKIPLDTAQLAIKVVTYNHGKYIGQCLDSILMQQTNFDFYILLGEDQSNDGTREICIAYAIKYPNKIRLLLNSRENNIKINGKPTGTFNSVYANYSIKTKYIAFLEGDDYWTDEFSLQKRFDFLEANDDFVMCFHNAHIFLENEQKLERAFVSPFKQSTVIESENMIKVRMDTLTRMYRHGLIDLFDEEMLSVVYGDLILKGKLSVYGKSKYLHHIKPAVYRVHDGGICSSSSASTKIKDTLTAWEYLKHWFERERHDVKNINEELAKLNFFFFLVFLKSEKKMKANFLYKGFQYAKEAEISLLKLLKNRIKRNMMTTWQRAKGLNS